MQCDEFWSTFEVKGLIPGLKEHLDGCPSCRKEFEVEGLLSERLSKITTYRAPESLWNSVAEDIGLNAASRSEVHPEKGNIRSVMGSISDLLNKYHFKPALAGSLITLLVIFLLNYFPAANGIDSDSSDISVQVLEDIEVAENNYITAIDRLSNIVENNKGKMDTGLLQMYREKLAMLDNYISLCKDAIVNNEQNTNVRKYLLMAYKDKVDTLREMSELIT